MNAKEKALSRKAGKDNKPTHYEVRGNTGTGSSYYKLGYTSNPQAHLRESKKGGWKRGQIDYVAQYKK